MDNQKRKGNASGFGHRLPFFYGWVVVAVAFVTLGVAVNTRTAFSLLFPPILSEFGWDRGLTASAFSFGFIASTFYAPFIGTDDDWLPVVVVGGKDSEGALQHRRRVMLGMQGPSPTASAQRTRARGRVFCRT